MNNDFSNSFGQRITPEMAKTNEEMQYIATFGQQAFNEFKSRQMNTAERMRLRDEFAMAALTGCLAYSHVNPMSGNFQENSNMQIDCEHFYKYADAMLAARDKSIAQGVEK